MTNEELRELIGNTQIKLWFCPDDWEHRKHPVPEGKKPIVEWDGDLATCLICGKTNG
jgi:hypothetical protein